MGELEIEEKSQKLVLVAIVDVAEEFLLEFDDGDDVEELKELDIDVEVGDCAYDNSLPGGLEVKVDIVVVAVDDPESECDIPEED